MLRFLITALPLLTLAAENPEWRAGMAMRKITPATPIPMAGYAKRIQPFTGVDTDLWGKALALEDVQGNRALLINAEILGFPSQVAKRICSRIKEATGLERKAILLNGSHTHSGPVVAIEMGWPPPGENAAKVSGYVSQLEDSLVAAATEALNNLRPARLSWGQGVAPFVMNRREWTDRGVILGANPRGPVDRSVPVLRIDDSAGKLIGVVFGTASHGVTMPGTHDRINGDFPGYAQTELERAHPGAQAMFLAGCGADANPYPKGSIEITRAHGKALAEEVARVLNGKLSPVQGPLRTELRQVDLPLRSFTRAEIQQLPKVGWQQYFVERALAILDQGGKLPEHYGAPFGLWQFGNALTLVAFSGETVVDYVAFTESRLGPLGLWVTGYGNDLFGYLPSARILAEGGYETRGLYMGIGLFDPKVQDVVMAAVEEMARAAGRKPKENSK